MLTLCMIMKDEYRHLDAFLKNIKSYVDEIVVVDTGSKDGSREIARRYTGKVYDFPWSDDFAAARNFSISKATKPWILVLDPDEIVEKEHLLQIKELATMQKKISRDFSHKIKESPQKKIFGYRLIQETYQGSKIISTRGICRLFRNDKRICFIYPIHETVRKSIKKIGRIAPTRIVIKNYPKITRKKKQFYLKLLQIKKERFPGSNVARELALEN